MPEPRDLPLFRWGEELRRRSRARRAIRSRGAALAAALAVTAVSTSLVWPPRPALIWNASASSPIGLYHVTAPGSVGPGATVLAWAPAPARRIASDRGYLPANVPLVKHVAGARGDRVCASGEALFLNGGFVALRRTEDGLGRPLPSWDGCRLLLRGELFLLAPGAADSFDGRYFGITQPADVIGRARLIWAR